LSPIFYHEHFFLKKKKKKKTENPNFFFGGGFFLNALAFQSPSLKVLPSWVFVFLPPKELSRGKKFTV